MDLISIIEKIPSGIKGVPKFKSFCLKYITKKSYGLAKMPNGKKIPIDLNDTTEVPIWLGLYPRNVHSLLSNNLKKDSTFVDCGANLGIWSLLALSVVRDENGKVFSYEPNIKLFERLLNTKRINSFRSTWSISNIALSNHDGEGIIHIDKDSHQLSTLNPRSEFSKKLIINCKKLDHLDEIVKIDGMKIDVEGHEFEVLQGAYKKITSNKPWLVVEFNSTYSRVNKIEEWNVAKLLFGLGYLIKGDIIIPNDSPFIADIIFYHPDFHNAESFISLDAWYIESGCWFVRPT